MGFPCGTSGKEVTCQYRRCKRRKFDPWVGKIPWRRAWQFTPVFLPEEPHGVELGGLQSMGCKELDMTECQHSAAHSVNVTFTCTVC